MGKDINLKPEIYVISHHKGDGYWEHYYCFDKDTASHAVYELNNINKNERDNKYFLMNDSFSYLYSNSKEKFELFDIEDESRVSRSTMAFSVPYIDKCERIDENYKELSNRRKENDAKDA